MAKKLIDRIKESLAKQGLDPRTPDARTWLRSKVKNLKVTPESIIKDRDRLKSKTFIGKMYFFFYDPKTKEQLSYYDTFPLVIPIERYQDGFLGLNLHYIHPKYRITLLDKLSQVANNDKYDETTKLKISYDYLRAASKMFEATPCLKRYLFSQIQSRFIEIDASEWDIAILLPVEQFKKQSQVRVWAESKEQF